MLKMFWFLTRKKLREFNLTLPLWFFQICIFYRGSKALLFCYFWYYHWKFHWIFSSRLEDMNIFFVNNYFHPFFLHFLVANNLMTAAYNGWSQQFFNLQITLHSLLNTYVKLYWYWITLFYTQLGLGTFTAQPSFAIGFFCKQRFFSTQPCCCLSFSGIEL